MVRVGQKPKKNEFDGPSKPLQPYFTFCSEHRERVTQEVKAECDKTGTPFHIKLITAKMSALWKVFPDEKKVAMKTAFSTAMEEFKVKEAEWKKSDNYKSFEEATKAHELKREQVAKTPKADTVLKQANKEPKEPKEKKPRKPREPKLDENGQPVKNTRAPRAKKAAPASDAQSVPVPMEVDPTAPNAAAKAETAQPSVAPPAEEPAPMASKESMPVPELPAVPVSATAMV